MNLFGPQNNISDIYNSSNWCAKTFFYLLKNVPAQIIMMDQTETEV